MVSPGSRYCISKQVGGDDDRPVFVGAINGRAGGDEVSDGLRGGMTEGVADAGGVDGEWCTGEQQEQDGDAEEVFFHG